MHRLLKWFDAIVGITEPSIEERVTKLFMGIIVPIVPKLAPLERDEPADSETRQEHERPKSGEPPPKHSEERPSKQPNDREGQQRDCMASWFVAQDTCRCAAASRRPCLPMEDVTTRPSSDAKLKYRYTVVMVEFGTGPTLREASPWLQDDDERRARILDVTERNSVIEGLPPFRQETRLRILQQLTQMDAAAPAEAPRR